MLGGSGGGLLALTAMFLMGQRAPGSQPLVRGSLVTGCAYLEFFDAGAGIIGEALCVRDLDVFPIQNPSQVISYMWTETKRELRWAVARKDKFVSTG